MNYRATFFILEVYRWFLINLTTKCGKDVQMPAVAFFFLDVGVAGNADV